MCILFSYHSGNGWMGNPTTTETKKFKNHGMLLVCGCDPTKEFRRRWNDEMENNLKNTLYSTNDQWPMTKIYFTHENESMKYTSLYHFHLYRECIRSQEQCGYESDVAMRDESSPTATNEFVFDFFEINHNFRCIFVLCRFSLFISPLCHFWRRKACSFIEWKP